MVDLERSFNCYYKDRLAIYDSDDVGAPLIAAICSFENVMVLSLYCQYLWRLFKHVLY